MSEIDQYIAIFKQNVTRSFSGEKWYVSDAQILSISQSDCVILYHVSVLNILCTYYEWWSLRSSWERWCTGVDVNDELSKKARIKEENIILSKDDQSHMYLSPRDRPDDTWFTALQLCTGRATRVQQQQIVVWRVVLEKNKRSCRL